MAAEFERIISILGSEVVNAKALESIVVDASVSSYQELKQRLEKADERDLWLAAEAVVDAAIWRQKLRAETIGGRVDSSDKTRQSLIELVFKDPSMTSFLFTSEAWERH